LVHQDGMQKHHYMNRDPNYVDTTKPINHLQHKKICYKREEETTMDGQGPNPIREINGTYI